MTAKNKANVLIEKFYQAAPEIMGTGRAYMFGIKMALITVDEIVNLNERVWIGSKANGSVSNSIDIKYWMEVKKELKKS